MLKRARAESAPAAVNRAGNGENRTFRNVFPRKRSGLLIFLQISGFGRSTSGFRGSRERSRGQAAEDRRGTSAEVTTIEPEFDSVEETIGSRAPRQRFRDRSR